MSEPWGRRSHDAVRGHDRPVLIVGGGPAGLATALALARLEIASVVVERSAYDDRRLGEHLTPVGLLQLRALDPGFAVSGVHGRSAGTTAYWGSETAGHTDYFLHPGQHGLNLSRPHFDADLARAAESVGAKILRSASLRSAVRSQVGWQAQMDRDGGTDDISAAFIVDATGRPATFSRQQGAEIQAHDRQVAVATFWDCADEAGANTRSLIETVEDGWWYCAPIGPTRRMCMFVTDDDLLPRGPERDLRGWWLDQLARTVHMCCLLQGVAPASEFITRSARSQCLDIVVGSGWLATGDAAMAFDPLASQGIVKALDHGQRAAVAIAAHLNGDDATLATYALDLKREYSAFQNTRTRYYGMERRWPRSIFWSRRDAGIASHSARAP
ncbi:NAD(P)/FAD-dependent oxidoreductase [Bradyrhizobium guangdongense]|uniref:NAD(P)/FAD-dependent oxidoreductase n=1 Tax=Bradyrhizobium guangdongense TaxID=1325090 RepID=UPI001FEE5CE0|nr:FAD-dependent monooxygenase [Bradyrhizobium guangdongense]TPQ31802.1 NAD(P)/FAD-dependent oxidoreductase [Bradyrhizobium guangdongense]